MTNLFVALLPNLLFAVLVGLPVLLRLTKRPPQTASSTGSESRLATGGRWIARGLPGLMLAGYIAWMTMPRAQNMEAPARSLETETPMTPARGPVLLSRLGKGMSWLLTITASLLLVVFILWMTLPRVFDVQAMIVLTGSMEPTLPVGSVAFVDKSGASGVKEGDVITFRHQETSQSVLVTHRVIEVVSNEAGVAFRTQGDANSVPDDWLVNGESVVGKVRTVIPYVGYVTDKVRGRNGFLLLMAIPGALIIAGEIGKIRRELRVMRTKESPA